MERSAGGEAGTTGPAGLRSLLVANRGEVAVRIVRAAADLGLRTVAVHAPEDTPSLHTRLADESAPLRGSGPAAYLDGTQILQVAARTGCDAVHPGYGFLSERAGFSRACAAAGLTFVGPAPEVLEVFGDKARSRALAERLGVPVLPGTDGPTTLEQARAFLEALGEGGAVMVKALAGGGGRGMRAVTHPEELAEAYARCRSEARNAFGDDEVYVERLLTGARHVEVQVVGDGTGAVSHLGERECSLQRRRQKLVETAPAPELDPGLREQMLEAAVRVAGAVRYGGVGTVEFLVEPGATGFAFLEVNPRLQVEHTVTEEVTGVDLVQTQMHLAAGRRLADLGLLQHQVPHARGLALQARVNLERVAPDGSVRPTSGTLTAFEVPSGPGVRVDSFGYPGYRTTAAFDPLLAKVIVHVPSGRLADAAAKACRTLGEFRVAGVDTNLAFLRHLLQHPDVRAGRLSTSLVEDEAATLAAAAAADDGAPEGAGVEHGPAAEAGGTGAAGHADRGPARADDGGPEGTVAVPAPLQGTVVAVDVTEGDLVHAAQQVLVMEAMKMEHPVAAGVSGVVRHVTVTTGDTVPAGQALAFVAPAEVAAAESAAEEEVDLDHVRPDLAEVRARHEVLLDAARPAAVERRRARGQRTARENIDDLCDPGTFVEYGGLAVAAQRRRRPLQELIERTPADGLVTGFGSINGHRFGPERAQCAVMAYDYTVLAGTQGAHNHAKTDRLLHVAAEQRLPTVVFTEGGGGRPGDTDVLTVAGLHVMTFARFARLSGLVPLIGIVSGRCFAGNAALLGCCDVVIATRGTTIGMGGPAMIEGGGLGTFRPEDVGPLEVQEPGGVVDVAVADEAEGVAVAKRYLSYFQGPVTGWEAADQRLLRRAVPEERLRVYDIRTIIDTLADTGSVLELRRRFAPGMITALARVEGRPLGVVANNPAHLAGAITSANADKAARFLQLCDAFDLPVLFLCDTPGIMVGPEAERTALVRHAARLFLAGSNLGVPFFTIVVRKGYGLGAQAMAGGSFAAGRFTVAWPTGEFGAMGLEGAVKLGFRAELAAIDDPAERQARYEEMVAAAYEHGKAITMASFLEIDDVIDPAESRRWITGALRATPATPARSGKKRPFVDAW